MTSVTLEHALKVLNRANITDPDAMYNLLCARVPCNQQLANDPTIQVGIGPEIGFLGILNGIFGIDANGYGNIAAIVNVDKRVCEMFVKMRRGG